MAKDKRKVKPQVVAATKSQGPKEKTILPFSRKNYFLFALGLLVIVVGYVTLGYGSITLAPILLVLGYCVIIPVAIIINGGKEKPPEAQGTA
jgi:uncharacterized membrane protein